MIKEIFSDSLDYMRWAPYNTVLSMDMKSKKTWVKPQFPHNQVCGILNTIILSSVSIISLVGIKMLTKSEAHSFSDIDIVCISFSTEVSCFSYLIISL